MFDKCKNNIATSYMYIYSIAREAEVLVSMYVLYCLNYFNGKYQTWLYINFLITLIPVHSYQVVSVNLTIMYLNFLDICIILIEGPAHSGCT